MMGTNPNNMAHTDMPSDEIPESAEFYFGRGSIWMLPALICDPYTYREPPGTTGRANPAAWGLAM